MPPTTKASDTVAGPVRADGGNAVSLEDELRRAEDDFANGDYVALTLEKLDRCVATGETPGRTHAEPGHEVFQTDETNATSARYRAPH